MESIPSHSLTYAYLIQKYGLVISWKDASAEKVGRSWVLTTKALADYIDLGPVSKRHLDGIERPLRGSGQKRGAKKYVWPEIKEA